MNDEAKTTLDWSPADIKIKKEVTRVRSTSKNKAVVPYSMESMTLAERALFDMRAFAELIMFHGGWSSFSSIHSELVDFISFPQQPEVIQALLGGASDKDAKLRRLCLMPRGHLKSTINTTLYTMWRLYRNPEIRILVGTNRLGLSNSFIRELRAYFENESLQSSVWNNRPHLEGNMIPELSIRSRQRNRQKAKDYDYEDNDSSDKKLIWNNQALQVLRQSNAKEPSVFATSVGTSVVGQHYDIVILDDVVDFKNTESDIRKQRVNEWIADIESVLDPWRVETVGNKGKLRIQDLMGGEMVISGTRYVLDDYYGYLIENLDELEYSLFSRNVYKNGVDNSDGYLWEERFNDRVISNLRTRLTPRRFASQYLNTVYEKDARLFAHEAIVVIDDNSVYTKGNSTFVVFDNRTEEVNPIVVIDPAFSSGKKGDDCAILVGAKLSTGHLVVFDAVVEQMTAAETVATTQRFCRRYNTLRMFHEQNGVGMLLPELFKTDEAKVDGKQIVVISHYETRTKESKIQGVLELPIAAGKLVFTEKVKNNLTLWKQIRDYPAVSHDDGLDGLVTLWEKTLVRKNRSRRTPLPGELRLNVDIREWLKLNDPEQQKSFLGEYNAYYG